MDGHAGTADLITAPAAKSTPAPASPAPSSPPAGTPAWDRFAHWPRDRARLGLLALLLILIASALVPLKGGPPVATASFAESIAGAGEGFDRPRDKDLVLYDRASESIQRGEHYYDFIVEQQRRADYPVTPGFAVRLPTLAYLDA